MLSILSVNISSSVGSSKTTRGYHFVTNIFETTNQHISSTQNYSSLPQNYSETIQIVHFPNGDPTEQDEFTSSAAVTESSKYASLPITKAALSSPAAASDRPSTISGELTSTINEETVTASEPLGRTDSITEVTENVNISTSTSAGSSVFLPTSNSGTSQGLPTVGDSSTPPSNHHTKGYVSTTQSNFPFGSSHASFFSSSSATNDPATVQSIIPTNHNLSICSLLL